jgi:negative regulator of flagellin synthesis FlgM
MMRKSDDTNGPETFRAERVEAIKRAIAEGRFEINAEAIAERMLDSARELIRREENR